MANPRTSCSLIDFVNALKKGGLYVIGHVHVSDSSLQHLQSDPCQGRRHAEKLFRLYIDTTKCPCISSIYRV